jgi:tetratricopeptide (TPR) repeat protein
MLTDAQGLSVTTERPETVRAIDRFVQEFLGYGTDFQPVLDAAEADPGCVVAQAHAAALMLFAETGDAAAKAKPYIRRGIEAANAATERERLYLWSISTWAAGDYGMSLAAHKALAQKYPRDLAAAKVGQVRAFALGDSQAILALGEAVLPANADNHFVHGMVAFGYEQCHRLAEAEAAGRKATTMDRRDPWAHHAVAHVMETEGRVDEGLAWMAGLADTWETCNSFMYTHNWWHVALFHLDRDDHDRALEVYDTRVWGRLKEYSQDQVNAVSLLARLALRGVDVGARWADVAAYLAPRTDEHVDPFLDLHYLYGLAKAGRDVEAARLLSGLVAHAGKVKPVQQAMWQQVAVPVARALIGHALGRFEEAADLLGAALPDLHRIGGSHAQRDLFEQIHLDALIRAGRLDPARAIVDRRLARRPNIAHTRRLAERLAA